MKTAAVALVLGAVMGATALDLTLGVLWVVALLSVLLIRRRLPLAPWLVLVGTATLVVWGSQLGWFPPPAPTSYETGWTPEWLTGRAARAVTGDPAVHAARDRLAALSQEETRLTGAELEQRAGAVLALARRLDPVRGQAPREVALVEGAARRLARTLAAAEFRDLEGRRAAAAAYLADLQRRLDAARDASEAATVLRAADPAAMAQVSLRPVREDLAAASAAVEGLVRALGGGVPAAGTLAFARYDEDRGQLLWDVRYTVAGAPRVRLLRVETRAFRAAAPAGRALSLEHAPGGEAPRPVPPGAWAELEPAPRGVTITAAWAEPATAQPIRARFRPLAFQRIEVVAPARVDDAIVVVVVDDLPGLELPVTARLPAPRLGGVVVPRHALYFASRDGTVSPDPNGERWEPTGEPPDRLAVELVPRSLFLRNGAFAWVRGYLYRPNVAAVATTLGLACLTLVLVRRPRPRAPERE